MTSRDELVRDYTKAILDGSAAIFAGAGLSRSSGYVDWKNLLRDIAFDINLNIDKETDLISVAQYYKNEKGRHNINQLIMDAFTADVETNENTQILTSLPISTYWTTNYDCLIEDGLKQNNKRPDVKFTSKQLTTTLKDRDALVYKMHGDVGNPADAVLTKDDYEMYDTKYQMFRTVLQGDLIAKTFLFIGFSFDDPNLNYVLSKIHVLLGENQRRHFCFFKNIDKNDPDYEYNKGKQELRIRDLVLRYGIHSVMVDSYDEITDILREIRSKVHLNNIFISGSAASYSSPWCDETAGNLAYEIARKLIEKDYCITSGFGFGIGSSVINGALDTIYKSKYRHMDEHLILRPFPQNIDNPDDRRNLFTKYRTNMISETGVAIFLFGNKRVGEEIKIADGCMEEYQIALEKGCMIIPIASTGWAAKAIMEDVKTKIDDYHYLKEDLYILENESDIEKISNAIVRIVGKNKEYFGKV